MFRPAPLALAVAVSAASMSATAAPTLYGWVDIGIESYSESSDLNIVDESGRVLYPGSDAPVANTDGKDFSLTNGSQSRLGLKGEEALEDGWVGQYRMELRANVLEDGGAAFRMRLGWLGLSKGDHHFKVGAQWSPFFAYSGWNTHRAEVHGVGSYFYITNLMVGSTQYGYRNDATVSYTYGDGAFSDSPFTATVALHVNEDDRGLDGDGNYTGSGAKTPLNDSGVTATTVAAAATFGPVTVNGAYIQSIVKESDEAKEMNIELAAPSIYSLGAKVKASDALDFGFAYRAADRDEGKDSGRQSYTVSAQYQLNPDLSLHLGYGMGSDDDDAQLQLEQNVFGMVQYELSGSRHLRFEFEQVSYEDNGDMTVGLFSMRQAF
ncbi:hypothetical protein CHH28_12300 [Bacterioplanes sanyensis]|uniref:Porin domain-containing protein n=1 Tax=Bacterioplanes sanyensis TaxID=1249553 RepID=A0A222FLD6_9GAMM|nr:porin [Bacterioplanes sanyensis]ASP39406.1 hypothetical protein CHH28_12300 [Bacterioplanes sanyensis]